MWRLSHFSPEDIECGCTPPCNMGQLLAGNCQHAETPRLTQRTKTALVQEFGEGGSPAAAADPQARPARSGAVQGADEPIHAAGAGARHGGRRFDASAQATRRQHASRSDRGVRGQRDRSEGEAHLQQGAAGPWGAVRVCDAGEPRRRG